MTEPTEFSLLPGSPRVAELARRVPAVAWPFVILAGLRAAVFLANTNGAWSIVLLLLLASNVAWALLPAAIFLGCPDAWRSARGVVIGGVVWSTVGVLYALGLGVTAFLGPQWPRSDGLWLLHVLVQVAEIAGPAIVAFYLERRRETSTTWPIPLVLAALVGTATLCLWQGSNAIDWYNYRPQEPWASPDEWGALAQLVMQTVRPLGLLTLGVLAWSGLSAHRASERPRDFWLLVVAGSAALIVPASWGYAVAGAQQVGLLTLDFYMEFVSQLMNLFLAVSVTGVVLLLVAFARGLPEDSVDLGDVIDGGPEPDPEPQPEPAGRPA